MLRGASAWVVSFSLVGLTLVACSSLPDLHFDEGDGSTPGGDAGGVEGSLIDGATEGGPVDPNCKPSGAEICDDGVDNDCNGKTDCEDGACGGGFTCQEAPAGWAPVGFASATQPSCTAGVTATDLRVAGGDGAPTCSCACGTGSACQMGNFVLSVTNEATCGVAPATINVPVSTAGCTSLGSSITLPVGARAKIAPPAGTGSCSANKAITNPLTNGRVCEGARFGGGCIANHACAPKLANGFTSCISKAGIQACPSGFTKRSTAGTSAVDSRVCNGCTCNAPTCTGGTVSIYDGNMCKTNGQNHGAVGIASACAATTDTDFVGTHYMSTSATASCSVGTPVAPAGTIAFTGQRTVCCK